MSLSTLISAAAPYVDLTQPALWLSFASITFNPTAWNIVARNEHHNHTIERAVGSPYLGCYILAASIFGFGMIRDHLYNQALSTQPASIPLLLTTLASHYPVLSVLKDLAKEKAFLINTYIPVVLVAVGQLLVVTSTWALGITGTFLGDYFGILMNARVEGFPFNALTNPMYVGSTMCFLGVALWKESVAGLLITLYVHLVYKVALMFEEPFTDRIYAERAAREAKGKKE